MNTRLILLSALALSACLKQSPYQGSVLSVTRIDSWVTDFLLADNRFFIAEAPQNGARLVTCSAPECNAPKTMYTNADNHVRELAVDSAYVYWILEGDCASGDCGTTPPATEIYRAPRDGTGSAEAMSSVITATTGDTTNPTPTAGACTFAVNDSSLCWYVCNLGTASTNALFCWDQGSDLPVQIYPPSCPSGSGCQFINLSSRLGLDAQYVYWADGSLLYWAAKDAPAAAPFCFPSGSGGGLSPGGNSETGLLVDGTSVYWAYGISQGGTAVASWQLNQSVIVDSKETASTSTCSSGAASQNHPGGWMTVSPGVGIGTMAIDANDFYWIAITSNGAGQPPSANLERASRTAGSPTPETLAGGDNLNAFALDNTYVYWSQNGGIYALAK